MNDVFITQAPGHSDHINRMITLSAITLSIFQCIIFLQISGSWYLVEYITSMDGKPFPPHSPYLCPESKMIFSPGTNKMNISQVT